MKKQSHFPLFVPCDGKKVLVLGGGTVATRRVETLLGFDFKIQVISLWVSSSIRQWWNEGALTLEEREMLEGDLEGVYLCLLCTDDPKINEYWGEKAKKRGILTSQAQDKSLCDFYFPAVVVHEEGVIGITGNGHDHKKVKDLRKKMELFLDTMT